MYFKSLPGWPELALAMLGFFSDFASSFPSACHYCSLSYYHPVGFVVNVRLYELIIVHLQQDSAAFRGVINDLTHFFSSFRSTFCLSWSITFLNIHWLCVMCSTLLINCLIHWTHRFYLCICCWVLDRVLHMCYIVVCFEVMAPGSSLFDACCVDRVH